MLRAFRARFDAKVDRRGAEYQEKLKNEISMVKQSLGRLFVLAEDR